MVRAARPGPGAFTIQAGMTMSLARNNELLTIIGRSMVASAPEFPRSAEHLPDWHPAKEEA
jgi:hypothetical protein